MSRSHDNADPDAGPHRSMDLEARPGSAVGGKNAAPVRSDLYEGHETNRGSARSADSLIENLPGLNRAQRDLQRAYPRAQNQPAPHNAKTRRLPAAGEFRTHLSDRQRKARSKTKRQAQDGMPAVQHHELSRLVGKAEQMNDVNERLHKVQGNAQLLSPTDRRRVQRIDRAIAGYERNSDRGHVVYFAAQVHDVDGTLQVLKNPTDVPHTWQPGRVLSMDEYTMTRHTIAEVDQDGGTPDRTVLFELETQRGMYLGSTTDDTRHLLPRGIHAEVVDVHHAPYSRPGQQPGDRLIIQLRERTTD